MTATAEREDIEQQENQQSPNDLAAAVRRRQALEARVILLAPSFGWYRGQYQLPRGKTDIKIDGDDVSFDNITTPCSKLMTDKYPVDANGAPWKKRLQQIESRQKALIEKYSVPFPIRGVRIVPKASAQEFFRELDDVIRDLRDAADEFVRDLPDIIEQMRRNTNETVYKAVERKIPRQRDQMRAKFYIDVVPVEIAGRESDATVVTRNDLATHQAMVQDACQRKVEEAIEAMIEQPRQQLADALEGLKDVIDRNGRVSTKSFRPVEEAMRKLRSFSFVANDALLAQLDALERRMNNTVPNTLDQQTAASNGFSAALNSVLAEVADADKQASDLVRFGRESRGITLQRR